MTPAWKMRFEHDRGTGFAQARQRGGGRAQAGGLTDSAGFFSWQLPTGEVVCDEQTLRLHGLPEDAEPSFEDFLSAVPPEDVDDLLVTLNPLLGRVGDYLFEYRVGWPDGSVHSLEARARVIAGPEGEPQHIMGILADVTQRRAAEEAAHSKAESAARMQSLTTALAAASTIAEVREATQVALAALGADVVTVLESGSGPVEVALSCSASPTALTAPRGRVFPAAGGPMRTALAENAALFFPDLAALERDYPQAVGTVRDSGLKAAAFLPLTGVGRMRGVCLIGFTRPVAFAEPDRAMLVLAAGTIGQAVQRAKVHDTEHGIAVALQEGMLPRGLKFGPGLTAARRYDAATTGIQVGGDWYDSIPLPDGSTVLIIGDVEGHNAHAAGMMYRLRMTVRAYATDGHPVPEVLRRANESMLEMNEDAEQPLFATCLAVHVDPRARLITASRAGHIPPFLAAPGAGAVVPHNDVGVPLGIEPAARYPVWQTPYEPGTVLLLCTDGLLECLDNNLDSGIERSVAVLDQALTDPGDLRCAKGVDVEALADRLLNANRPSGLWKDDVALLLAELR
ncbi:MAG TPA: SpoIIE family protein phosphatase [Actinocrinis sp.]